MQMSTVSYMKHCRKNALPPEKTSKIIIYLFFSKKVDSGCNGQLESESYV